MSTDNCIIWQGRTNGRYGIDDGFMAHRKAWERQYGPVPKGMIVHHACETLLCVNPLHLVAVTHEEHRNMHPRTTRRKDRKPLRPRQHGYLFNKEQIEEALAKNGNVISQAAKQIGLSRAGFYHYLKRFEIRY